MIAYFDGLTESERGNIANAFAIIEDAYETYPDGLMAALGEYAALPEPERLAEFARLRDPSAAKLDEVLGILTDEQAEGIPQVFPAWATATAYTVGQRVRYADVLYRCLQAHTSQDDWTPDATPALWAKVGEPSGDYPVWEQPDSTNPYMTGDRVHYPDAESAVYESLIDNNVWSPEAYPAGWQEVA